MKDFMTEVVGRIVVMGGVAFFAYIFLVWVPVYVYHESTCLERGYPETRVTMSLDVYCTTLDSAVPVETSSTHDPGS